MTPPRADLAPPRPRAGDDDRAPLLDALLAAEAERDRLADLLHQGLMQSLVVTRHALDREARPAAAPTRGLPTAADALAECLAETRRLVWHLRSRTADGDLAGALADLAERLRADGGAALHVAGVQELTELSAAQAAAGYRVVQVVALVAPPGTALEPVIAWESGVLAIQWPAGTPGRSDAEVAEWCDRASAYDVTVEWAAS